MKPKSIHLHKSLKKHLSVISFIATMMLIFISLFLLVPSDYKGELNTLFLDTPHAKSIKIEQGSTLE